jgi:putative ABC transport system permease protein
MLRHYLLLAAKVLMRRKLFTGVSLFGISGTLVVFLIVAALFDQGFGPGAPELRQDRMLGVRRVVMWGAHAQMSGAGGYKLFDRYARNLPGVERLTLFTQADTAASYVDGRKIPVQRRWTDGDFWQVFDFTFVEGAPYTVADVAAARRDVVITVRAREQLLGASPAVGKFIELDGETFRVVGVVSNVSELRAQTFSDAYVPHTASKSLDYRDQWIGRFMAVALATSKAALPGIRAEFDSRLERAELPGEYTAIVAPFETPFESFARQLQLGNQRSAASQGAVLVAALAVLGVLVALLPTVNLINLNVSRILERASEIGVRKAFGASSRSLVVQFVVENVLLTVVGAGIAFVLAAAVMTGVNHSGYIANAQLAINLRVFAIGIALALAFGVFSGVYPAWRMSRLPVVGALKGDIR